MVEKRGIMSKRKRERKGENEIGAVRAAEALWISNTFGLSLSEVQSATKELISLGILSEEKEPKRTGSSVVINTSWKPEKSGK